MPPVITEEQKNEFLECIRAGGDNGICGKQVGSTGTRFRQLLNPRHRLYDHQFAGLYEQAVRERDPEAYHNRPRGVQGEPLTKTLNGFTRAKYLTIEDLVKFLEQVREGIPRQIAAHNVGTSMVQIKIKAAKDVKFADAYADALEVGYPHYVDRLRGKAYDMAVNDGDYRALRDLLMVHAEEYEKLRTSRHEIGGIGGGALKILAAHLPDLPPELLNELISQIEAKNSQKQIEMGDVIDATPRDEQAA